MKQFLSRIRPGVFLWLRRCHFPALFMLALAPVALFALGRHAQEIPFPLILFPAAALLLCMAAVAAPGRRRMRAGAAADALLLLIFAPLLPLRAHAELALLLALAAAALLFSLSLAGRSIHEISPFLYVLGVAAHLVTQALVHSFRTGDPALHAALTPPLTLAFVAFMALLLLAFNRISLDNAGLGRYGLPASMKHFNTLLTLAFLVLALLLAGIPAVVRFAVRMKALAIRAFLFIGLLISSLLPESGYTGGGGEAPSSFGIPTGIIEQPSAFALFMEKVMSVVTIAVLIVGCAALLRMLGILLKRLARHLIRRLHRFAATVSEDYVDEITDTREEGEREGGLLPRLRRRRAVSRQDDTPAGRIRARYARLLQRHPRWADSSTARENLPQSAAVIYERARYSSHPVTAEDADRFAGETNRI